MAIRRITELPRITEDEANTLSDALMEFSIQDGPGFKSTCGKVDNITKLVTTELENNPMEQITIEGNLCVGCGDISFNIDDPEAGDKKFQVKFGEINLCAIGDDPGTINIQAQNQLSLKGNPVNINNNLSVWTNRLQSNNPVYLTSNSNTIYVKDVVDGENGNQAVNLNYINGKITPILNRLTAVQGSAEGTDLNSQVGKLERSISELYEFIKSKCPSATIPLPKTIDNLSTYLINCNIGSEPEPQPFRPTDVTYQFNGISGKYIDPSWNKSLNDSTTVMKKGLTDVYFPERIKYINKSNLFKSYQNLSSVVLDGVISASSGMFNGCKALQHVTIGSMTKTKGQIFDSKCTSLTSVAFPKLSNITGTKFMYNVPNVREIELGEITVLPQQSFMNCNKLISVKYNKNENIELSVGLSAFMNCYKMAKPNFIPSGDIPKCAFSNCSSMTDIDLSNVKNCDLSVFSGCTSLTSIGNINENFKCTSSSFKNCTSLKNISITYSGSDQKICKNIHNNYLKNMTGKVMDPKGTGKVIVKVHQNLYDYLKNKATSTIKKFYKDGNTNRIELQKY